MEKIYGRPQKIYKSYFGLKNFVYFLISELEKKEINTSNNN